MAEPIYHNHHIIPRHAGGTDAPDNLVKLTVQEHAEAHKKLWEEHGRLEDRAAWLGLCGNATEMDDTMRKLLSSKKIEWYKTPDGIAKIKRLRNEHPGVMRNYYQTPAGKLSAAKMAATKRRIYEGPEGITIKRKISASLLASGNSGFTGKRHSDETKAKMSAAHKKR